MRRIALALGCLMLLACEDRRGVRDAAEVARTSTGARLESLLGAPQNDAFARALAPRAFEFPRDHGAHPEFRHEWWYVTGHLDAAHGERFGFELTFFRYALAPPAELPAPASRWRSRQIYAAHFAVTDVARKQFVFAERRARDALGLAGARADPLRVWVQDWSLEAAAPAWQLAGSDGGYALALELEPVAAPVLNGERGLSRKSAHPGAASYYYSIPRLSARGELVRAGERIAVSGSAWLDREWGSGALASDQQGWDWFALQLDDGSALMFYALRKRSGARDPFSAGTWIAPDGSARHVASTDVDIEVLDRWHSPRGGAYPSRWRLRVPALDLELELRPVLADQELDTTPRYWEGAVDVSGRRAGRGIAGRGYVELTGYAGAS